MAAAAGMHWELNHCFLPLCFVGPAELCAGVRLPLDKNTWIQCEIGPANSALLWVWAAGLVCVTLLKAELREAAEKAGSCFHLPSLPCHAEA